jgi:hypothetical protein
VNDETNYVDDYNARRVDGARRVRDARHRQSRTREEVHGDALSGRIPRHDGGEARENDPTSRYEHRDASKWLEFECER